MFAACRRSGSTRPQSSRTGRRRPSTGRRTSSGAFAVWPVRPIRPRSRWSSNA